MKNLKMLSIVLLTIFLATSCDDTGNNGIFNCTKGDGDVVTQELIIDEFKGLRLRGSSLVYLTQGNDFQVMVEGQSNIIDLVELDIQNDIWEIEFEDCIRDYVGLKFYITMPEIESLEVSGSGEITGENDFDVDDLDLEVDGSGEIEVSIIDGGDLKSDISGSGKIKLSGNTDFHKIKISGNGDLYAFDLETNKVDVKISGAGDSDVTALDELDVKITGSGDVSYKGNPTIDVSITGSGKLKNAN